MCRIFFGSDTIVDSKRNIEPDSSLSYPWFLLCCVVCLLPSGRSCGGVSCSSSSSLLALRPIVVASSLRVVRAGLASFSTSERSGRAVLHSRRQLCSASPGPGKMAQAQCNAAGTRGEEPAPAKQQRTGTQQRDTALDRPQATASGTVSEL